MERTELLAIMSAIVRTHLDCITTEVAVKESVDLLREVESRQPQPESYMNVERDLAIHSAALDEAISICNDVMGRQHTAENLALMCLGEVRRRIEALKSQPKGEVMYSYIVEQRDKEIADLQRQLEKANKAVLGWREAAETLGIEPDALNVFRNVRAESAEAQLAAMREALQRIADSNILAVSYEDYSNPTEQEVAKQALANSSTLASQWLRERDAKVLRDAANRMRKNKQNLGEQWAQWLEAQADEITAGRDT